MNAEFGCVCAADEPPGPYSTRTPFMLLPGTFGSGWSKTTVTFLVGSPAMAGARAGVTASVARRIPLTSRVNIACSWVGVGFLRLSRLALRPGEPRFERRGADLRVGARREGLVVQLCAEVARMDV